MVHDRREGGTQKSSWLLLARLPRPLALQSIALKHLSESFLCNTATHLVGDQGYWSALDAHQLPCCPPHDAHQVPTPSPKLESIGRPPRPPPTLHIDEFHFQPLDHLAALDPPMYIHLRPNLDTTKSLIHYENWPHVNLHFSSTKSWTLYPRCSFIWTSCETGTRPARLCFYSLVLSADKCFVVLSCVLLCCLVNTQINVSRELHMKAERSIKQKQHSLA